MYTKIIMSAPIKKNNNNDASVAEHPKTEVRRVPRVITPLRYYGKDNFNRKQSEIPLSTKLNRKKITNEQKEQEIEQLLLYNKKQEDLYLQFQVYLQYLKTREALLDNIKKKTRGFRTFGEKCIESGYVKFEKPVDINAIKPVDINAISSGELLGGYKSRRPKTPQRPKTQRPKTRKSKRT